MKIPIYIIIVIASIGCNLITSNELKNSKNINLKVDTVKIESKLKEGQLSYLYYYDKFQDVSILPEITKKSNFNIPFIRFLLIKDTENQGIFPIYKTEVLTILKDNLGKTILNSKDKKRNVELNFINSIKNDYEHFFTNINSSDNFKLLDSTKNIILASLIQQNKEEIVNKKYFMEIKGIIEGIYALHLIEPFLNNDNTNFPKKLLSKISASKDVFNNESNIINSDYRMALIGYSRFLSRNQLNTSNEFTAAIDSINSNFKGEINEFLLFHYLKKFGLNISAKKDLEFYNKTLANFFIKSKDQDYIDYLRKAFYLNNRIIGNDDVFNNSKKQLKFKETLKNQITYVDFWASWCAPCRAEMPASIALKIKYTEKGINFVYISTDKNPVAWEKAIQQIGLSFIENYILPNGNDSPLAKQLKIESIPRYLIFDKKGNLINSNAPRPSDPKLVKIFDELLMKQ